MIMTIEDRADRRKEKESGRVREVRTVAAVTIIRPEEDREAEREEIEVPEVSVMRSNQFMIE